MLELIIAMMVLNIGIFAVLSAFTSGYTAMKRTKQSTSGSVLSDQQLERLRALNFNSVCISTTSTGSVYTANAPEGTAVPTCSTSDPAMVAVRNPATGPDRSQLSRRHVRPVAAARRGRSDDVAVFDRVAGLPHRRRVVSYATKLVRVIVRDRTTTSTVYARFESTFDQSTGQ